MAETATLTLPETRSPFRGEEIEVTGAVVSGGAVTLYNTEAVCGLLSAEDEETDTEQEKLPTLEGASTEIVAMVLDATGTLPATGEIWHQAWLVEAVKDILALPLFPMVSCWAGGVEEPLTPEKLKLTGFKVMWEVRAGGVEDGTPKLVLRLLSLNMF